MWSNTTVNLVERREAKHIVGKPQPLGVAVVNGHSMVKRQQIAEKRAHLPGSENEYLHLEQARQHTGGVVGLARYRGRT